MLPLSTSQPPGELLQALTGCCIPWWWSSPCPGNPSAMKLVVLGLGAEPSCRRVVQACESLSGVSPWQYEMEVSPHR